MDVQYTSFRIHPLVQIKLSFKAIILSIAKVRIGNLNAPDKPISLLTKIEGRFRIYTPMPSQS